MKRAIAMFVAGVVAASVPFAFAGSDTTTQTLFYRGILCKTSASAKAVVCVPLTERGYGVGISRKVVLVEKFPSKRIVFHRLQP